MPTHHVAILLPCYIDLILRGQKTIESRLTRRAIAPYQIVRPGDLIHFKASGGGYRAAARAGRVHFFQTRVPEDVTELESRFNAAVCADDAYWRMKRDSRFATFIELRDVYPVNAGPTIAPSRGPAWFVLDADRSVAFDVTLTEAAIRNGYVRIPVRLHRFPHDAYAGPDGRARPIALELPDGQTIQTDLVRGGMLRWRGWSSVWRATRARAGDRVCFETTSTRCYRVSVKRVRSRLRTR